MPEVSGVGSVVCLVRAEIDRLLQNRTIALDSCDDDFVSECMHGICVSLYPRIAGRVCIAACAHPIALTLGHMTSKFQRKPLTNKDDWDAIWQGHIEAMAMQLSAFVLKDACG